VSHDNTVVTTDSHVVVPNKLHTNKSARIMQSLQRTNYNLFIVNSPSQRQHHSQLLHVYFMYLQLLTKNII